MKRITSMLIIFTLTLGLLAVAGCTKVEKVYVCADGKEYPQEGICKFNKVAGVKKIDAENYAKRYVGAFFSPYGGKAQLVSSYLDPEKGDYFATFIVSTKGGEPYETLVAVDGITGKVACQEKCDYV